MTTRKIRDTVSMFGVVVLSAAALYFAMAAAKYPSVFSIAYIACFLLILLKRRLDKESLSIPRWQRFYLSLLFFLLALFYLVKALMNPLNGWLAGRLWIFGTGWLALAVFELYLFYQNETTQELQ
ncbi:MAG: hypothetical protein LAO76_15950 [Acidobacteriia bacterium]|nr:hypothetical protein [Terriglobia bacterium]